MCRTELQSIDKRKLLQAQSVSVRLQVLHQTKAYRSAYVGINESFLWMVLCMSNILYAVKVYSGLKRKVVIDNKLQLLSQ